MVFIKSKWLKILLVYISCSVGWIAFNMAYNTTDLNNLRQLNNASLMTLKVVWYVILYILSYWCLQPFKFLQKTRWVISLAFAIVLYFLCGLTVLISHSIMGYHY